MVDFDSAFKDFRSKCLGRDRIVDIQYSYKDAWDSYEILVIGMYTSYRHAINRICVDTALKEDLEYLFDLIYLRYILACNKPEGESQ
jgi:hypothetical protein